VNTSAPSWPEVRALICDLYGTLLKVLPPREDAAERWRSGLAALLPGPPPSLTAFNQLCREIITGRNESQRQTGEAHPEVDWLEVILEALPTGDRGSATAISRLHAECSRTCVAMPGAAEALERFRKQGVLLGIASNAQDYTRLEFTGAGFRFGDFESELVFLSGEHGFAKPSPRVFSLLAARLALRGIAPGEILMAGDSLENDIQPATAAGWQTRLIGAEGWD
jgi:FMN phosphatase YigB (HAD superfamily)